MDNFDARRASLDLVTAFVNNNKLGAAELPTLLSDVFRAISGFEIQAKEPVKPDDKSVEAAPKQAPSPPVETRVEEEPAENPAPEKVKSPSTEMVTTASPADKGAVSVKESLADPNVIVSLITGEKFKMLKRHLRKHGLTEAEYKARFNLPADYPMVAKAYAELRREVAKTIHAKGKDVVPAAKPETTPAPKVEKENPKQFKAKRDPKKKASTPKKGAPSGAEPAKQAAAPSSQATVAAADVVRPPSGPFRQSAQSPMEAAAADADRVPQVDTVPRPESAKSAEAPKKAPAKKPSPKRRMARRPATETITVDAAAGPAPSPAGEAKATDAGTAASPKPAARKSKKSGGAPATAEDGAKAKPARKERKILSPVYP